MRSLAEGTILNLAIVLRMTTFAGYFGRMSIQVGRIGFFKSQLFLRSLSLVGRPSKPQNPRLGRNHNLYPSHEKWEDGEERKISQRGQIFGGDRGCVWTGDVRKNFLTELQESPRLFQP